MGIFNDYVKSVFAVLNADPLLTGKVSESLDDMTGFPKIWIEDGGAVDWSNKSDDGIEATVSLHIGSRYRGTKEIREYMQKCHNLLHNGSLGADTGQIVLCRFVRHDIVSDSDGITRHGIMRFVLLISEVV